VHVGSDPFEIAYLAAVSLPRARQNHAAAEGFEAIAE
jgi:hypothetical protein